MTMQRTRKQPDTARTSSAPLANQPAGAQVSNAEQQERLAARAPAEEQGGWLDFIATGAKNLQFDGMFDRFSKARGVEASVAAGADPSSLGIDKEDYRLRNIAEMQDVAQEVEGKVDHPAAHSLRDANFWFYTLFGNNAGSFKGMDMERYREIAAMPGKEAANVLPEFEAETFKQQDDPATIEIGNSLPAEQRGQLFKLHNTVLSPGK